MRVEAPTTMMQAYQQGRQNRRQDKLDDQKLAFSIFDEKRQRDKHELFIDSGEESLRHAKTMNPLMESLRLYENELKFNTLDSSIARHKEETRHQREKHLINEATMMSTLDNQQMKYGQGTSYLQDGSAYDSNITPDMGAKYDKKRDLMVDTQISGLDVANTELSTQGKLARMDDVFAGGIAKAFNEQGFSDYNNPIYKDAVDNRYKYPNQIASGENILALGEQVLNRQGQGFMQDLMNLKKSDLARIKEIGALKDELRRQIPDLDDDEYDDVLKQIEVLNKLMGGNMSQGLLGLGRAK